MTRARRAAVALTPLTLVALAGCGEGSGGASSVAEAEPVKFAVASPRDGAVFRRRVIQLRGTATPGASIETRDARAVADANGNWQLAIDLKLGPNAISIAARHDDMLDRGGALKLIRKRNQAEVARLRASRARAAQETAQAAPRESTGSAGASTTSDWKLDQAAVNELISDYLSAVLDDEGSAEPNIAMISLANLSQAAPAECRAAFEATIEALRDTSGGPDAIRRRVLDAAFEITLKCPA